jgi:hypothetical protein
MFRGGKVDSRGTGITSGLMDKPKRGLVDEPGGYSGELITQRARSRIRGPQDFPLGTFALDTNLGVPVTNRSRIRGPQDFIKGSTIEEAEGLLASASDPFVPDETPGFDGSAYNFFTIGDEMREENPKLGVGSDFDKDMENYLTSDPQVSPGLEALRKGNIRDVGKTTIEDLTTTEKVKTPKPGDDDEPEVTMTDLEKALGLDKARQEYAADALAAASKAFFEGRGFEAISDAAQVKSKAPDIKRLAALEEFKADRREKLFDKKQDSLLKQRQGTKGAFQKKLDTITKQPEGTQGHKIALIENNLQPTIQGQIASETVDNNYTRPAPAVIIGYMDLYYPQSYAGTVAGDAEMAGKKAGTYITEDATTIIFWDGENARTQSI